METSTKYLLVGGGVALAAIVVVAVVEETKSKPAAPAQSQQLTTGHRYTLVLSCPTPVPSPSSIGLPGANIVSISPQGQTMSASWTVVFDYTGASVALPALPDVVGCTVQLTDQGLTPAGTGGTKKPGGPYQKLSTTWGQTLQVSKSTSGIVVNTQPGDSPPASVDASPAVGASSFSGQTATISLTGQPGTFNIWGPPPSNPKIFALQKITVVVS